MSLVPISIANLVKIFLMVLFILSTCPELWGLYAQCNFESFPSSLATS